MKSALLLFALAAPAAAFQPANKAELKAAVDNCCDGGLDGTFNNDCEVSGTHIKDWDTSLVTDMSMLFYGREDTCFQSMNANITKWDTSSVNTFFLTFRDARTFNQPLEWDTSQVIDSSGMRMMFRDARSFNQPLNWATGTVKDMNAMFYEAYSFNQPLDWNVGNVENFENMFFRAFAFNQDLSAWDVTNAVTDHPDNTAFRNMFMDAYNFNQPLNWDLSGLASDPLNMFARTVSMLHTVDGTADGLTGPCDGTNCGTCNQRRSNSVLTYLASFYTLPPMEVACDAGYIKKATFDGVRCVGEYCADNSLACCDPPCPGLGESDCKAASACWWAPDENTCSDTCDEAIHPIRDAANKICGGFVDPSQCISSCELGDILDIDLKDEIVKPERSAAYQMAGLCN